MADVHGITVPIVDNDADDRAASTVPTTPEGSCTFSPVVRAASQLVIDGDDASEDVFPALDTKIEEEGCSVGQSPIRNICCVGAGYVGGPTAAVIAFKNPHIRVTIVDRDERRIRRWNSKHPPIYEPGLRDIVRVARDGAKEYSVPSEHVKLGRHFETASSSSSVTSECGSQCGEGSITVPSRQPNLFFSTEVSRCISEADIVLVAVNTPTKTRGQGAGSATDMAAFEAVTAVVARHARPGAIIVEKSTVPCRTAELVKETLAAHRPGVHFEILSNPEFLAAGTAVNDLLHPDRVLIGSDTTSSGTRAAAALAGIYAGWVPRSRILTTNVWSSELAKLVANAMLAQRISSINSISAICERTGADVDEVAASVGRDPRIGDRFLKAGIGFGGSCFKKDILSLVYLAESLDLDEVGEYWRQVVKMNEYARDRFTRRVVKCLNNTLAGKKITVLGYAFKKDTSDTRESPALEIIRTLLEEGPREIAVFDPCCNPLVIQAEIRQLCGGGSQATLKEDGGPLAVYGNAYDACRDSNAVLITTEFDEFRNTAKDSARDKPGFSSAVPHGCTTSRAAVAAAAGLELRLPDVLVALQTRHLQAKNGRAGGGDEEGCATLDDPLGRYITEPACAGDCPDCRAEEVDGEVSGFATTGLEADNVSKSKERVDWERVARDMQVPRWVFDGRGVIDVHEMVKLGVRVESVGKRGRS
ncbi:nucleotide sugar dehydrogenase [Colletotrichum orchidophilum]|uniref:UDP-glucose 6-dehydrogenase n=1 Tax=Colletotrichum orchidophilum TaxID=1209926 RepID=A0A1G4BNM4_9PEZI|nr:nucleotide sugar dehydrogenase [Colletotrichum orchidophilum]OHF03042.1 nucleotide sugar dehydrogenase [Colletotrichum orchidophilum]